MYVGIGRGVQNLVDYTGATIIEQVTIDSTQGSPNDTCKITLLDRLSAFKIYPEDDLIISGTPSTGVPSANLLKNPGFDTWSGGYPSNWSIDGPYDPVGIPFQQDLRSGYTYDGQGSLFIPFSNNTLTDSSGNPVSWVEFYQSVQLPRDRSGNPLVANPYAFTMWMMFDAQLSSGSNTASYPQMFTWYLDQYGHVMAPQNDATNLFYVDMSAPWDTGSDIAVTAPDTYRDADGYAFVDGFDDHTWRRYSLITQPPIGAVSAHVAVGWRIDLSQDPAVNPLNMHIDPVASHFGNGSSHTTPPTTAIPGAANLTLKGQVWIDACQFEYCTYAQKQGNYTPSNVNGSFTYSGSAAYVAVPDGWSLGTNTENTAQSPTVTATHGTYNNNPNAIFIDIGKLSTPEIDTAKTAFAWNNNLPTWTLDGDTYQDAYSPSTSVHNPAANYPATTYGLFNYDRRQSYQITMTYKVLQNVTAGTYLFMTVSDFSRNSNGLSANQNWSLEQDGPINETASSSWKTLTMQFGPNTKVPFNSGYYQILGNGNFSGSNPSSGYVMDTTPTTRYPEAALQFQFGLWKNPSSYVSAAGQYLIGDITITAIGGFSTALTGGAYPTPYVGPGQPGAYYDGVAGLWFNQDRLFGGYVKTVNSKYLGGSERYIEISAIGYGVALDDAPANILVHSMSDVAAIQKAVTYAQNQGFAVGVDDQTYMTSISTIDNAVFTWTTVKDVIDKIADYSVASWYVDYYRYIHFHPALADTFTYSLSANPDYVNSFPMAEWEFELDGTQDLTSEVVEGSPQISYPTTVSVTATSNYSSTVLNTNPRRYYRLGETAGATTIVDSSPYVINGSVNGGVTFAQSGAIQGDSNTAALFNGTTGYCQLPEFSLPNNNGNWSMALWFKMASSPGSGVVQVIGAFGTWGSVRGAAHIALNGTNLYAGSYGDDTNYTPVNSGQYYHAVATYDGGKRLRLYINGQLAQEHIMQGSMNIQYNTSSSGAVIGANCNISSINNLFNGTIDEFAIFDHELSAQEVLDEYNASLGPVSVALNSGNGIVNLTSFTVNNVAKTVGIKGTDSANNFQFLIDYNNGTVYDGSATFNVGDTVAATFQFYYPVLVRVSSTSAESPTGSIGRRIYQYTQATELTSLQAAIVRAQSELALRTQARPLCKCTIITPSAGQQAKGFPTNPILRPGQAINIYHPPSLGPNPQLFQVEKVTTTFAGNGTVIRKLELGSYIPNVVMHIVFLRRKVNRIVGTIGSTTSSILSDDQSLTDSWTVNDGIRAINIGNAGKWNGPSTWTTGSYQWD